MKYYKRSPFLVIYWNDENKIIVFNYNRQTKAVVSNEMMKVLETLLRWKSSKELFDLFGEYNKKSLRTALQKLIQLKIVHTKPVQKEDRYPTSSSNWNPIDLAMQRQTDFGGYYPQLVKGKPPHAFKNVKGLDVIKLATTPHHNTQRPFYEVLQSRESSCIYAKDHMDMDTLSHFLYSCCGVKKVFKDPILGTMTTRPYPSGGARHPLEIYLVCNHVEGMRKGVYYYHPLRHELVLLNYYNKYQKEFNKLIMSVQGPVINREPDAVFLVTAVFARTMWKYKNMGLSLIMKDLGCLYQTMYLVATEMKLAPCPVGLSRERLVTKWLNLDWFVESHVGTFLLGKKGIDVNNVRWNQAGELSK